MFAKSLPRCLIYDSLGEYQVDRRIYDLPELCDFFIDDERSPKFFRIAYDTHLVQEHFPDFCRLVLARGNIHLIIEELDLFSSPYNTDPEFLKLLKYGRHYGVQIIGVSRRPAEVSRAFTSAATRYIIFTQHEPRDLQYFRSIIGKTADQINTLPKYHHLSVDFNNNTTEIMPPV